MRCGSFSFRTALRFPAFGMASRFLMKHYSHNSKLTSYAIAVVYNLVNYKDPSPRDYSHLEYVVRNRDVMHLIFSRGLPDNEGLTLWIILP